MFSCLFAEMKELPHDIQVHDSYVSKTIFTSFPCLHFVFRVIPDNEMVRDEKGLLKVEWSFSQKVAYLLRTCTKPSYGTEATQKTSVIFSLCSVCSESCITTTTRNLNFFCETNIQGWVSFLIPSMISFFSLATLHTMHIYFYAEQWSLQKKEMI